MIFCKIENLRIFQFYFFTGWGRNDKMQKIIWCIYQFGPYS